MEWFDIPLDIVTVTIAAIVFGLVVDDTVHLLHRYTDFRRTQTRGQALQTAARTAGHMMAITAGVLVGGFLVLGLAHNRSGVWFGLLVSGTLGVALIVDLLLVPPLLASVESRSEFLLDNGRSETENNDG